MNATHHVKAILLLKVHPSDAKIPIDIPIDAVTGTQHP
jgi:hypothetical protein